MCDIKHVSHMLCIKQLYHLHFTCYWQTNSYSKVYNKTNGESIIFVKMIIQRTFHRFYNEWNNYKKKSNFNIFEMKR